MSQILSFLKQNEKYCLGVSIGALAAYLVYRSKRERKYSKQNLLETSLPKLMAHSRHANIRKLVITSDHASKGSFRRNLINFIKSKLTQDNYKVLINCSPLKLLRAGCECFLESMEHNDSDYTQYYYNALKTQYLVEDTISNIELINQQDSTNPIIMICDTNPMDIKIMNESDLLWTATLKKHNISEDEIIGGYDVILHVIEKDSNQAQDVRIKQCWANHTYYYIVKDTDVEPRDKCNQVFEILRNYLQRGEEKIVLAS